MEMLFHHCFLLNQVIKTTHTGGDGVIQECEYLEILWGYLGGYLPQALIKIVLVVIYRSPLKLSSSWLESGGRKSYLKYTIFNGKQWRVSRNGS